MKDHTRYRPGDRLRSHFQIGEARGEGHISDLSSEGLFVHSPLLPEDGAIASIAFQTPEGHEITVQGRVRWSTRDTGAITGFRSGFGVRLSRFGTDYSAFLNALRRRQDVPDR